MYFSKYHGTGNDFILLKEEVKNKGIIPEICDRHFGIGADGLMYPSDSEHADIKMNYFNSDGSVAKMCGNGLRCFVQFCRDEGLITLTSYKVETLAGIIDVEIVDSEIRLGLGTPDFSFNEQEYVPTTELLLDEEVLIDGYPIRMSLAKQGTLHAIVYVTNNMDIRALGPMICHNELFPDDINVNFVEVIDTHTQKVTTYERGAGWTLSCGTGASASAVVSTKLNMVQSPVSTIVPGGTLTIFVDEDVKLQGPAVKIAHGEYEVSI